MSTLYEAIGGEAAVNAAVDIFYKKVLGDNRVNGFFKNTNMAKQSGMQKKILTMVFGGPNKYTGKDMRAAHKHLKLNDNHFDIIVSHLGSTLKELKVPAENIADIAAIAESVRDDVLNR